MIKKATHLSWGFIEFVTELYRSRRLLIDLTRRELRARYLGSAFGLIWAFVHPAVMMALFWIVFQYFLKSGPVDGIPYVAWLLTALTPWNFISEAIASGANVVLDNRFLVKKVVFRVSLLPVVRLLTLLPVHLFFLCVVTIICWACGYPPSFYTLQIFYYLAAMMYLGLGLTWLVSAIVPFFKDLSQVVQVLLQILFWVTPVVWAPSNMGENHRWILWFNPAYYILTGYRESLLGHVWFWQHPLVAAFYWTLATGIVAIGGIVFLRLRPHFADVL